MGKTKDFSTQFEVLKKFKEEHTQITDKDEFFKSLYSRMRKYVKKWNKIIETEEKIQNGSTLTKEQNKMLQKKDELIASLEEMDFFASQYSMNFEAHLKLIRGTKPEQPMQPHEEGKEEVMKEEETEPQPQVQETKVEEPKIDIIAIKKEEYQRGCSDGINSGYEEGRKVGYEDGKKDGITQAKQEFEAQEPEISTEDIERAIHYYSLIHVFGYWVDSFVMLNPHFMRSDYFTEEECFAIKQIYIGNSYVPTPLNFGSITESLKQKVLKIVNRSTDVIENPINTNQQSAAGKEPLTYANLAESFDRVLTNQKFNETSHMLLAPGADMMGMNMYGAMPNMMPGQKMQQIPVMTNPVQQEQPLSTPAPQVQPKNEVEISKEDDHKDPEPNQTEEHKIEPQEEANAVSPNVPENTTPKEVVVENIEAESQDEQQVEPQPEPEPQPETKPKDLWNDDEDEDEDDENEDSSEEDHEDEEEKEKKENTPEPQETPEVPEAKDIQVKDKEFYDSAPYHKRGGRGYSRGYPPRGPRGAYRGGRGYNKPYDPNYRGGRGGRGGRGPRGSYESGRGRGTFRGGRGKDYYQIHQSDYHYEDYNNPQEKKTEQDMDADGFMPVKEKVYKKKKRGGNFKPKRGQKDTK